MPSTDGPLDATVPPQAFSGHLDLGSRPALVVIDMAMAYFETSSPLYAGVEPVADAVARLLSVFRGARLPIVFTEVHYQPGGLDGGIFYRKVPSLACFDEGSPLAELHPATRPRPGEVVVRKQYASAFFGTSLASTLRATGVDTVVLTGLSTSGCVRASATEAIALGFVPVVVREAVGDRHRAVHEANLYDLQLKSAEVLGEDEVVAYVDKLSG